jgi:chaperonin GroES
MVSLGPLEISFTKTMKKTNENQNMHLSIKPLGDRIVVEAIVEKSTEGKKGDIIIPDSAKEKPMESLVVALGTGKTGEDGNKIPFEIKRGDRVLANKYGGTEIKLEGKEYKILNVDDILAIIE